MAALWQVYRKGNTEMTFIACISSGLVSVIPTDEGLCQEHTASRIVSQFLIFTVDQIIHGQHATQNSN